jgi:hypothetical protein
MRLISAVLLSCLIGMIGPAATAADAPDSDMDAAALSIDAGRLVVMVDQSADALNILVRVDKNEDGGPESGQSAHAFADLVSAVLRYDVIAREACRAGVVSTKLCTGPYLPAWLKNASDTDRSNVALRSMIDDATSHLEPFWSDICSRAKQVTKDQAFCQLE